MSFVDWYYPQPVTDTDEAEKDREKVEDSGPDVNELSRNGGGGGGNDDSFQSGVASTFGQGSDIDIGKLSMVDAQDIKYTDFNTYLDAQGLPARKGFFSSTDFSTLNTGQSFGSKFASKGVGPTASLLGQPPATSAMVGLVGAALQPSRTVSDPTGKSTRHIPDSGILNAIASMNIAEEYKDLGTIKTATEKLGASGTRFQKGSVIHMNGRPIYRLPNQRYWKHKIQGVGQIGELQGNNLERLAASSAIQNAIITTMEGSGTFDGGEITQLGGVNATFAATPNGGYNLSGAFNFGGQTTSKYGNKEDMAAMGASFFGHIEGKAAQYGYAETVIRGLQGMPSSVGEKERLAFINSVYNKSKDGLKPSQIIKESVAADKAKAEAVKTAEAAKAAAKAAGNPSMAQGYEGDYASGVEGGLSGEMSRDEQANEYSDTGDYDDGGYDGDFAQGGKIKGYAEGDMIEGEQATAPGDPIITANEAIEGNESGFIQAPPSQVAEADTVADDVPMNGDVGGEIINASAVAEAGEADIAKMIADAEKYAREKGIEISEDEEKSGIQVSAGEVYVKKDLIPIIGRDKIRKINNRGKKDTDRKIKQTQQVQMAAEGGFIKKKFAEGDTIKGSLSRAIGSDKVNITQQDAAGFMSSASTPLTTPQTAPSTPLPKLNKFETEARSLLEVLEDNRSKAYVPKGRSKSGATIGIGFDIGQHSVSDLRKMGLDSGTIDKLTPYTMKKGQPARNFLKSNPLSLSSREVEDVNAIVMRNKYEKFERVYPEYSQIRDVGKRAVMFSAFFGGGLNRYTTFKNEFDKAQNMEQALKKGLINIVPKGAAEHNRAKKALNWYRQYGIKVMPTPKSKPRQNPSATR